MRTPDPVRAGTSRRSLLARSASVAGATAIAAGGFSPLGAQETEPLASPVASPLASTDVVQTTAGPVTGLVQDGVAAYKGIPYAAPPLNELRWVAPQLPEPWSEPLAATDFCHDCMQVVGPESLQTEPSEDCLCLNVWRPYGDVMIDALLPVVIWIHGGAYVAGGSSIPWFDGAAFARQGIVLVSFNYRLGRFGFFAPTAVLDNTDAPYANYGYLDQIAVLRWAQENISRFGGDPARVTIMGESAGGGSVVHLLTSPYVEDGLFHQAVVLSGGGRLALLDRSMERQSLTNLSAPAVDDRFAASLGVHGNEAGDLDQLRTVPAEQLVGKLDMKELLDRKVVGLAMVGVPATDGEIVVGQPQDHFLDGSGKLVPIMIGTTAIDVPTHFAPNKLHPLGWFGPDEDAARAAYGFGDHRFLPPSDLVKLNLEIGMDITMHEPAHFVASTMQDAGFDSWVYRFTYTAESTRPQHTEQSHAGELPFLFDNLATKYGDAVTANDEATASAFNTYVSNFIKSGNPNSDGLPEWPPVTPGEFEVMNFSLDDGPVFGPDPRPSVALVAAAQERRTG